MYYEDKEGAAFDELRESGVVKAFIEKMRLAELGYFEKLIEGAKGDPKEQIKRFLDGNEVSGKDLSGSVPINYGPFEYDWDNFLKQPDVETLVNNMNLHFHGKFVSVALTADGNGLHVKEWIKQKGNDQFIDKFMEDKTIFALRNQVTDRQMRISAKDIALTVQRGEPTRQVKDVFYFFDDIIWREPIWRDGTAEKFANKLADAELSHVKKNIDAEKGTVAKIKRFFDEAAFASEKLDHFPVGMNSLEDNIEYASGVSLVVGKSKDYFDNVTFADYNWEDLVQKEDIRLSYYGEAAAPALCINKNDVTVEEPVSNCHYHAFALNNLADVIADKTYHRYAVSDVAKSVASDKFTKEVTNAYSFLAVDEKKKAKDVERD
jgi:hypothetical protein